MPDRKLVPRVAVIGCGAWGRNHVRSFAEGGALVAVADVDAQRAEAAANMHDVVALTVDEIVASTTIDAVVVATPAITHAPLARRLLEAGKDVLVEKPLALQVAEAESLTQLAENEGRVLMVGHLLQYHPAFIALRSLVSEGVLGRLQYIYSNRLNLGRFRREENILWSFAPHDISMILALTGTDPDDVHATAATYLHPTIADVTTTNLQFPGGERAHVFVSWLHPVKEQRLVVAGDRAMAVFDDGEPWPSKLTLFRHRVDWHDGQPEAFRADPEFVAVEPGEPLALEREHFLSCVIERTIPRTDGAEATRVLDVLRRAQESLETAKQGAEEVPSAHVHESSYVADSAMVGARTKIWHFCHVQEGATIGSDCSLGQNVVVGPGVQIGDRVRIQNNVSVYPGVTLEDGVFCGPSAVFTNVLNPRAEVERKDEFRQTVVRRGATIGANATIVCGNQIGEYSMVAAGAVVTHSVPAHALVAGVPARQMGWVSHAGEVLDESLVCRRTGRQYRVEGGHLVDGS